MEPTSAASIRPTDEDERLAREGLEALARPANSGALLIQFPISFKNTSLNREYVEVCCGSSSSIRAWSKCGIRVGTIPRLSSSFAQNDVAFCNIDQPLIGRSLEPTEHVTSSIGYVRMHGRNYDQWFESDSRDDRYNYLYNGSGTRRMERTKFSASRLGLAYDLCSRQQSLRSQSWSQRPTTKKICCRGQRVKAPEVLFKKYPELKQIADPLSEPASQDFSLLA